MENSNPLATESFSYSWLVDKNPHSSDKSTEKDQSFDFDVPFTSLSLVHADEIFSDGHIMPIYVDRSSLKTASSVPQSPVSQHQYVSNKKRRFLLGKWRKSSKRILRKCFGLVKPFYQTIGCSRKSNRVDDLQRKVCEVRSWSNSVETSPRRSAVDDCNNYGFKKVKSWSSSSQASPRISPARTSNAWCVDESSIHEAILYCKRSIGMLSDSYILWFSKSSFFFFLKK